MADKNRLTGKPLYHVLTQDSAERNEIPLAEGCFDYFPKALAMVARFSKFGNDKHNPGQPLQWSRNKSTDHANKIAKHLLDRGTIDPDSGFLHDVALAWRALANLEVTIERVYGGNPGRACTNFSISTSTFDDAVRLAARMAEEERPIETEPVDLTTVLTGEEVALVEARHRAAFGRSFTGPNGVMAQVKRDADRTGNA